MLDINVEKPLVKEGTRNYYGFRQGTRLVHRRTTLLAPHTTAKRIPRNHLYKTRYCIYGENCNKKENCPFAHTKGEIRAPLCMFGDDCTKKNTCRYKHPGETVEQYTSRLV